MHIYSDNQSSGEFADKSTISYSQIWHVLNRGDIVEILKRKKPKQANKQKNGTSPHWAVLEENLIMAAGDLR